MKGINSPFATNPGTSFEYVTSDPPKQFSCQRGSLDASGTASNEDGISEGMRTFSACDRICARTLQGLLRSLGGSDQLDKFL